MTQSMRDDIERAIDHDLILYQLAYAAGLEQGRAEVSCPHVHPAIAESVAAIFGPWDGADAAHRRSVARFRDETRRKDVAA